jgi:tRNA1(Val) A37 N6-methylase TrmN6
MTDLETTDDTWLGGQLILRQPANSYRIAIDAAFLAAHVSLKPGARALELGTGIGAASLALALRYPDATLDALELQPKLAAFARHNVEFNDLGCRVRIIEGDVLSPPTDGQAYDAIFFNPPYLTPEANDPTPDPIKRIATVEGPARLQDWLTMAAKSGKPGTTVTLIHRVDRLADVIVAADTSGITAHTILPIWPKPGAPAHRVIVIGSIGKARRLTMEAGITVHNPDGSYSAAAKYILEGQFIHPTPHQTQPV